jgi:putative restriction endonuclease
MTYREICIHMESLGPYMTDVVGKCLREVIAVQGGAKSAGHLYLLRSATYAAALKRRRLDVEYDKLSESKGFLEYTEDIKTGAISRYPVAVDERSGIVRQLNAARYGLLEDVEPCLRRKTDDGAFIPWGRSKEIIRSWVDPVAADISKLNPAESTYGSIAGGGRRVGQDAFRKAVFQLWFGKCAVTGCRAPAILRASHILRWEVGTTDQRNDPHNGILLAAHVDAAFEVGLISFADDGSVLVSSDFDKADQRSIGIERTWRLPFLPTRAPLYLRWHRKDHGF